MEFHTVRNEPGRLVMTAKQWRDENRKQKGKHARLRKRRTTHHISKY